MKREERVLCRLPTSCLMKPPTKFLVETYRFSKPVSFNVYCACLVGLYADNYRAHGRLRLPRIPRVRNRATKSSLAMLGDKRIKEITTLQRKVILGFLKDAIRLRVSRRTTANLSFLPRRERPLLAGKPLHPSLARRHSTNRSLLKKERPESQ